MNPLMLGVLAVGGIGLAATAVANTPPLNQNSNDDLPIDYSMDTEMNNLYTPDPNAQITAFLAIIRAGESSNNYYAKVGGGNIASLAAYPTWSGVGNSHAVGAYQFEPETWRECAAALNLHDFTPSSQDAAAVFLIKRRNAYNAILRGDIATACDNLKNEWEMFTQSKWNSDSVASLFVSRGGTVA
jgi:muramidase (phage lysozyme)